MAAGSFSGVFGRHRWARFVADHLADVLVVLTLSVLVAAVSRPAVVAGRLDVESSTSILTLVTAAVGSAAAIVALVIGRLTQDPRPSWFGAALLLYGVVVLPLSALVVQDRPTGVVRLAVLAMLAIGMVILIVAVRPPARLGAWGGWVLFGLALGVGGAVALQGESAVSAALAGSPLPSIGIQAGWAAVAVLFLFDGYRRQSRVRSRLGLGLLVIAVSQLYRAVVPGAPVGGLTYPSLRILGMAVVLVALLTIALRAVSTLQDEYDRLQETLGDATRLLERATGQAAERDHELRNGLAGLAGAAYLLAHSDADSQLRDAVLAELGRLREMLEAPDPVSVRLVPAGEAAADPLVDHRDAALLDLGPGFAPAGPGPAAGNGHRSHDAGRTLRQLVRMRAAEDGTDIAVEVDDGLPAVAAPEAVTRQIVTNLLANCARHAPGASVRVRCRAADAPGFVAIEVRDTGPGLPEGRDTLVITRGEHDEAAGGSGLGLHISLQLAEEYGGTLAVRSAHSPTGCMAVLTLPVAPPSG